MLVLGIESTCDETAIAVVESGKKILSNVVYSQADLHAKYGGVFPELASRKHLEKSIYILQKALDEANICLDEIDLIAVAQGPGLIGSIVMGMTMAKSLAYGLDIPLIGVNHIEAHLYSAMIHLDQPKLPALGLIVSGAHTSMVKINQIGAYEHISQTVDDAIGEAFDKVGALLNLPYPGGPAIEQLAKTGDPKRYAFKAGNVKKYPLHFSFSGLKTQVLYAVKGQNAKKQSRFSLEETEKKHIAASFQMTAFMDIVYKVIKAANEHKLIEIFLGGGVSNSSKLKELLTFHAPPTFNFHFPKPGLSTDNGAMIAGLGFQKYLLQKPKNFLTLPALSRISL